jgi:hypothetical protein
MMLETKNLSGDEKDIRGKLFAISLVILFTFQNRSLMCAFEKASNFYCTNEHCKK